MKISQTILLTLMVIPVGCTTSKIALPIAVSQVASYSVSAPKSTRNIAPPVSVEKTIELAEPQIELPEATPAPSQSPYEEPAVEPEVVKVEPPEKPKSTYIFGDSTVAGMNASWLLKNLPDRLDVDGKVKLLAKGGKSSSWLLSELRFKAAYKNGETLNGLQNAIVVIGANDLGSRESVDEIWKRILAIYTILRANGIRVYACTIAPAKGNPFGMWGINFPATEANRLDINGRIFETAESGLVHHVINLAARLDDGGLADNDHTDKVATSVLKWKDLDPVHADPKFLIEIFWRELAIGTNKGQAPPKRAAGPYDETEN